MDSKLQLLDKLAEKEQEIEIECEELDFIILGLQDCLRGHGIIKDKSFNLNTKANYLKYRFDSVREARSRHNMAYFKLRSKVIVYNSLKEELHDLEREERSKELRWDALKEFWNDFILCGINWTDGTNKKNS